MSRNKVIVSIITTLLLGFVIGFVTSGRMTKKRITNLRTMMHKPKMEQKHLAKKLDLSAEQIMEIQPILDSILPLQNASRKARRKQAIAEQAQLYSSIEPHLNREQKEKLAKMKKRQKRAKKRRKQKD